MNIAAFTPRTIRAVQWTVTAGVIIASGLICSAAMDDAAGTADNTTTQLIRPEPTR